MAEEIIQVENLTRQFGKTTALNDVNLIMSVGVVS